jgi:hypothetical protein
MRELKVRYRSAKWKNAKHTSLCNANAALPEGGYRALPIGAKSFLSAPCRKRSNLQPPLLHE